MNRIGNQVINSGVWTTIDIDVANVNINDCFDLVNDRYVCGKKGIYLFNLVVNFATLIAGAQALSCIYVGAVPYTVAYNKLDNYQVSLSSSCIVSLEKGDYVTAQVQHSVGVAHNLVEAYFNGCRVV